MPTTINNFPLAYDELGDPKNPALVFGHALAGDRNHFSEVAKQLSESFHTVKVDLHGHGQSAAPNSLTLERIADDCAALIASLGPQKVTWVGESMGGMVGMRVALRHPERIGALVLINTSSLPEKAEEKSWFLKLASDFRSGNVEAVYQATAPTLFCDTTFANNPELVESYHQLFTSDRDREGLYQAAVAVFERGDITPHLHNLAMPTLILSGEEDITYPLAIAEMMAHEIPSATLKIIPRSRHMSALEQPQQVAAQIHEFLGRH